MGFDNSFLRFTARLRELTGQGEGSETAKDRDQKRASQPPLHEPQAQTRTPHPGPLPFGRAEGESSAGCGAGEGSGVQSAKTLFSGPPLPNPLLQKRRGRHPNDVGGHDEEFNGLALELFALQFEHNEPYRRFCEARGALPGTVENWQQIPAMPTSAFKELELTCLPVEQRTKVFHSSGTTEHRPSRHFHSAESLEIYEEACWTWFEEKLGQRLETRNPKSEVRRKSETRNPRSEVDLAILTPGAEEAVNSSLVHMFETVRRRMGAVESAFVGRTGADGSWRIDFGAAIEALKTERPVLVLGTAFSFVHLLDYLGELDLKFKLAAGSRVMETGGYKGRSRTLPKKELHRLIMKRLGVPESEIVCEYGMSELSSQAYDRGARPSPAAERSAFSSSSTIGEALSLSKLSAAEDGRAPRHSSFPPWARAQIISPENGREVAEGETGLIRVFDLANVFSVMAIQTEDLGIRRGGSFQLVGRAELAEARGCSLMATRD